MSVFRWIVAILAAIGIGFVWWVTSANLSAAPDTLSVTASALKGALGLASTYLIASLLLRKHS